MVGSGIFSYFMVVAQWRLYTVHCSFLKVLCPKCPTGIPLFILLRGLCLRRLCLVSPSSPWLVLHGVYSPTAPAAPSFRLLIPNCSLIRCEPVQLYHYRPRTGFYIPHHLSGWLPSYAPFHEDWSLGELPFIWVGPHSVALVVARAVGKSAITSFYPPRVDCLGYFRSSVGGFPVAL
jgi:hypothetical protein